MSSPLYADDVECSVALTSVSAESRRTASSTTTKPSFLRKWGPALVAIAGVLAVNALLLGPTGSKIPSLSPRQLASQAARAERTQAVLDMEWDHAADLKRGIANMRDSRNLKESDGGVMEYTRRRHRYLGEYVHVDVSDQFTLFGKISISCIYFAFWVFLMFPNWFLPIGRPGIALGGGLSMVVFRYMLTTIYLEKMELGGLNSDAGAG